jgi:hypothetical protein
MTARRTLLGLCALCALFVSAIGASSASAVSATAYTCPANTTTGGEQFTEAHCKTAGTGNAGFKHVAIANGTRTAITLTNEVTPNVKPELKLKSTVAGAALVMTCETVSGAGFMENKITTGGEMYAHGTGTIVCTGVTDPTPGCGVVGLPGGAGKIETKELTATTEGQAAGRLLFKPANAGPPPVFLEFELTGCPLAGTYKVVGSVSGKTGATFGLGATTKFEHTDTTGQASLHIGGAAGPVAGLEGEVVIEGENGNPLALT